jgi:membrane dipeptidase
MKRIFATIITSSVLLVACGEPVADKEQSVEEKARAIHEKVIVLDTHHDFRIDNFSEQKNYTMRLNTRVNLPKMTEGGMDVSWLVVYTGQGPLTEQGYADAYDKAIAKFDAIDRLTREYAPDQIELATSPQQVRQILAKGKKVAMIGIENGYPIGTNITRVEEFSKRGARYMSLAHEGHSQLSDSNTGDAEQLWLHNGLSELGKQVIHEMNKWGIMIDISHPSKAANLQTMALSRAPVIASHSSARAVYDHSRNLSDEELLALRDGGGVVQAAAFRRYINGDKAKAFADIKDGIYQDVAKKLGITLVDRNTGKTLTGAAKDQAVADWLTVVEASRDAIEHAGKTVDQVTVADFIDHIDYMVELIGIDHVGISSDFDGGGGVLGWVDASETFNVTLELLKRGYSEQDIGKLWGENLLRVLDEVHAVAQQMQQTTSNT